MKNEIANSAHVNAIFLIGSRFVDAAAIILCNIIITRYLGAALFGQYSFILAYVVAISIISYFGLDNLTVREIAKHGDNANTYLGAIIVARWILSTIAVCIIAAGIPFIGLERELIPALILVTISELTHAWVSVQTAVFRAKEKMHYELGLTLVWRILSLLAVGLVAFLDFGLTSICAALLLANLVRAGIAVWITKTRFIQPSFSKVRQLIGGVVKDAAMIGAAMLVTNWMFRSAQVTLKLMSGPESVGFFQISHAMILQASTVAMSIAMSIFPKMSQRALRKDSKALGAAEIYTKASRLLISIGLACAAGIIFVSKPMILLLFGREYAEAVPVLQILAVALVPMFVYSLNMFTFTAYNKQHLVIISRTLCLVLVFVLYKIFIPRNGVTGAAFAYVAASAAIGFLEAMLLRRFVLKTLKMPLGIYFLNIGIAACASGLFVLGYPLPARLGLLSACALMALLPIRNLIFKKGAPPFLRADPHKGIIP